MRKIKNIEAGNLLCGDRLWLAGYEVQVESIQHANGMMEVTGVPTDAEENLGTIGSSMEFGITVPFTEETMVAITVPPKKNHPLFLQERIRSNDQNFQSGDVEIWYTRRESFRDLSMGFHFCEKHGLLPDLENLDRTHSFVAAVSGPKDVEEMDSYFTRFQGDFISGNFQTVVHDFNLSHTSMSVGDLIVIDRTVWMVNSCGFAFLGVQSEEPNPEECPHEKLRVSLDQAPGAVECVDCGFRWVPMKETSQDGSELVAIPVTEDPRM